MCLPTSWQDWRGVNISLIWNDISESRKYVWEKCKWQTEAPAFTCAQRQTKSNELIYSKISRGRGPKATISKTKKEKRDKEKEFI